MDEKEFKKLMDEIEAIDPADLEDDFDKFEGKTLNIEKWRIYRYIYSTLERLAETCQYVKGIRGMDKPYPKERYGSVCLSVASFSAFDEEETSVLADALEHADSFSITTLNGITRFNFCVDDIWIG